MNDRNRIVPDGWVSNGIAIAVALLVALSFGLSFGIVGNQNTYLLDGLRQSDPEFLAYDWLTQETWHYHAMFTYVVRLGIASGSLPWALAVGNLLVISAVLYTVYRILIWIRPAVALPAYLFLALLVCLDRTWSVNQTYILSDGLQASSFASLFLIVASAFFLKGRYWHSGVALAASGLFHTNFLVLSLPVFGLAHLLACERGLITRGFKQLLPSLIIFAFQLPTLLQVASSENAEAARYILTHVRAPHHYLPGHAASDFLAFAGWHVLGTACILYLRERSALWRRVLVLYVAFLVPVLAAAALTTVVFIPMVSQLFVFRIAPYSVLLAQLCICVATALYLAPGLEQRSPGRPRLFAAAGVVGLSLLGTWYLIYSPYPGYSPPNGSRELFVAAVLTITLAGALVRSPLVVKRFRKWAAWASAACLHHPEAPKLRPYLSVAVLVPVALLMAAGLVNARKVYWNSTLLNPAKLQSETDLYAWVRTTREDAVFAVPPNLESFRIQGRRAIVVDWKSPPMLPDGLVEWHHRMSAIAGVPNVGSLAEATDGYSRMTADRLRALAQQYCVTHAVFRRPLIAALPGAESVYANDVFVVLRAPSVPGTPPSENRTRIGRAAAGNHVGAGCGPGMPQAKQPGMIR